MFKRGVFLSVAILATALGAGSGLTKPLQSPGSIRTLPVDQGTITAPGNGSGRLNGHAKAYRLCFWTAKRPSPGIPSSGHCIAPAGGDPGTPCTCRTEYGKFSGEVG